VAKRSPNLIRTTWTDFASLKFAFTTMLMDQKRHLPFEHALSSKRSHVSPTSIIHFHVEVYNAIPDTGMTPCPRPVGKGGCELSPEAAERND
jgi:hypothetical protein